MSIAHSDRQQEELASARTTLRNVFDSSPWMMGIVEVERTAVLAIDFNSAAAGFFLLQQGCAAQSLLDSAPQAIKIWIDHCDHCRSEGLPISFVYDHDTDWGRRAVSVVVAPLALASGSGPWFTFVAEDLSRRKRLKDEVLRSQARFAGILESIHDGFLAVDFQWRIVYANNRAAVPSGFERVDLLERNLWEVFPELVHTPLESEYRKVMSQRSYRQTETLWDSQTWYEVRIYPTAEGISIYWADITQRKNAECRLQQINEQLEKRVAERTKELALMVDSLQQEVAERKKTEQRLRQLNRLYGVLSETNQAIVHTTHRDSLFQEICRVAIEQGGFKLAWIGLMDSQGTMRPEKSSGQNEGFLDHLLNLSRQQLELLPATAEALRNGIVWICNHLMEEALPPWQQEAAKRGFGSAAAIPLKVDGTVIGAFTLYAEESEYFSRQEAHLLHQLAADVSLAMENIDLAIHRRKAELKLAMESDERLKALEKLHQRERMLMEQNRHAAMGEMIGNIAHQWRQPLNTLALLLQRLPMIHHEGRFDPATLDDTIDKAMDLVFHMSQTIDDFRNYFKPDKCRSDFRLTEVVTRTLSLVEASFKNQGIAMEIRTDSDPFVNGYPNEFSQILLNILVNAKDAFARRKDVTAPQILITLGTDGDKTVVTVADNAGGIPEEIMPKIFDPYFTTKAPDNGTGIGLHMAKTIIERNMNGRLTAANRGSGAEFRIEV